MPMIRPEPFEYTARGATPYLQHTEFDASPSHRNRLAGIVRMITLGGKTRKNILEIGCGVGNIAIPVASLGHEVKAIDMHGPSVEIARSRNPFPNARFDHIRLEEIELRDFDLIILTEVLEHVGRYRDMLSYIGRNMRPGARLILTVPNGRGITELLLRPSYGMKRWRWGVRLVDGIKKVLAPKDLTTANEQTPHINFFSLRRLDRLFEENRLTPVLFHRYFFLWALIETLFSQRIHSERPAERDFHFSQHLSPRGCAVWAFLLEKKQGSLCES